MKWKESRANCAAFLIGRKWKHAPTSCVSTTKYKVFNQLVMQMRTAFDACHHKIGHRTKLNLEAESLFVQE